MLKDKWQKFSTNNYKFTKDNADYRRVILLNFMLCIMLIVFLIFTISNFFIFNLILMGFINLFGIFLTLIIFVIFKKTNKIFYVSVATTFTLTFVILSLLHLTNHDNYSLIWITVIPPAAFYLLGKKYGLIYTVGFFVYVFVYIIFNFKKWEANGFQMSAIFNIFIASFAIVYIIMYFEISKQEAYDSMKEKNKELALLSRMDRLTGIFNRYKLDEMLEKEFLKAKSTNVVFTLIIADLDFFKKMNDTYGHIKGDQILKKTAKILQRNIRDKDILGRWGGEEFLIICPDTKREEAYIIAERIRKNIETYSFDGIKNLTISIGLSEFQASDGINSVLRRADKALYKAKDSGRNRVEME